jgi:hypothetical protein
MKIKLKDLRMLIREAVKKQMKYYFGGSHPEEDYEVELLKDPAYTAPSVYVPDDIKGTIDKWAVDMQLTTKKKKK